VGSIIISHWITTIQHIRISFITKKYSVSTVENFEKWLRLCLQKSEVSKKAKTVKSARKMAIFFEMHAVYFVSITFRKTNYQWRLLRSLIGPFQYFKEKTSPFDEEESAFPSKQCTSSHTRHQWPNSSNFTRNCFSIQHIRQN